MPMIVFIPSPYLALSFYATPNPLPNPAPGLVPICNPACGTVTPDCALGFPIQHHTPNELEGAPSFARLRREGWALTIERLGPSSLLFSATSALSVTSV